MSALHLATHPAILSSHYFTLFIPHVQVGILKKYNEYIDDITTKMRHSLDLYASILLGRHSAESISQAMLENKMSGQDVYINIILVVKEAERKWLIPLKEKLEKELERERRIWKAQLLVFNEEQARKKHLVM